MRARRVLVLSVALVAAAITVASASSPGPGNVWSGTWSTNTGGLGLRWVTNAEGSTAIVAQGGKPCAAPTDYFRGGYSGPTDAGKVTGCTEGPTHLVARYITDYPTRSRNGAFQITYSGGRFTGTYEQDGGVSGPYTGTFTGHFAGDGHNEGGTAQGTYVYDYSFQGYADNIRVVSPLVGVWQLGIARIHGSGRIATANGSLVGNPGSFTVSFNPLLAKYLPGSLTAKVIGYLGHTAPAGQTMDNYLDLKVQVTQSTYASRGQCPIGSIGHLILEGTNAVLSNGKPAGYITLGSWSASCSFVMGFFNTDGGARTNPPFGGPPNGGEWAVVSVAVKNSSG